AVDVFTFDEPTLTAASVLVSVNAGSLVFAFGGKTVTVAMSGRAATTSNVTFADGSLLVVGDNATGTEADESATNRTGGAGNDQLQGMGGSDTLEGAGGDDRLDGGQGLFDIASYSTASGSVT